MASNLTDDQRKFYEEARHRTKTEYEEFNGQIEAELAKVRERIQGLKEGAEAARQMYDAACRILGEPNELEEREAEE
jgi:ElaB/YqjD/DUF883 family membrane-anchored ribosome-binding protein